MHGKLSRTPTSYKSEKWQEYIKSQKDIVVAIKFGKFSKLK